MGVFLVYLGKGDNDKDKEMYNMCKAIHKKLTNARIQVGPTPTDFGDGNSLPNASSVTYDEVWFCGHSRFVEADRSIRKSDARNLGGFPVKDIAEFVKDCVTRGTGKKFRLICCESAQQQRYKPNNVGGAPAGLDRVLGNEVLESLTNPTKDLRHFSRKVDARVSHLEGLILAMAELWGGGKNAKQPAFEICGLWGAGDITDNNVPISSFLQDDGSLEAQEKMNDPSVKSLQRNTFAATFNNAHCASKGLPDFFGYRIRKDLLVEWVRLNAARAKAKKAELV
ncbi:MAG TPA: hypothetical protein VE860_02300 [Chthoniobacterales bacterium]|jgi:hypothetical protein|nr:hypothetical protein [Chthoniobacterales bacterium]